jgi:septum formation protein
MTSELQTKLDDVQHQVRADESLAPQNNWCIVADTIVVAQNPQAGTVVLGQPDASDWRAQVRDWMLRLYSGRTHEVWTGFQVSCDGETVESVVRTVVRFCEVTPPMADWYVSTGESVGKAGGYAVQGAAAAFVTAIEGSLTNIIGLPVLEVTQALQSLGCRVPAETGSA